MATPTHIASEFVSGFTQPLKALHFLMKNPGLKRYAILPLILNVIFYALAIVVLIWMLSRWEIGKVEWDFWWSFGSWLAALVNWLSGGLKVLAGVAAVLVAFFSFTAVGMVLASPLNDVLSEKVEAVYCGSIKKIDLPLRFTTRAALLSVYDSLRNMFKQLGTSILCLPFLLIPVIGFIPLFVAGSYFSGFGFLDSAMARNFLRPKHKRLMSEPRFWKIVGLGTAMQLLFIIPLAGLLLLPIGVTAGTLLYCDNDWEKLFAEAKLPLPKGFIPPRRESE